MALIHDAVLRPGKKDLLADWVPRQPWAAGDGEVEVVARFRFDDPAGEVGVETFLLRRGDGPVLHVPLSYRGAPLEGADAHLVTTLEHSVLGTRWAYDAAADPVWEAAVVEAVRTGGRHADEVDPEGRPVQRDDVAHALGVPGPEAAVADVRVELLRVVGQDVPDGAGALTATWGTDGRGVLAVVR